VNTKKTKILSTTAKMVRVSIESSSGNWVPTAGVERVTAQKPFQAQPQTLNAAVGFKGLGRILRAARDKPAAVEKKG
jgi:hypothetical protein